MKLIIAGGRDGRLNMGDEVRLTRLCKELGVTEVVSGGARGIDAEGERFARYNHIPVRVFNANWTTHGKAAGPLRNRQMAEYADACVVFPGGAGSASMAREARAAGIKLFDWRF